MKKQFLLVFFSATLCSTINSNGINPTLIVQVIKNTHLKTLNSEYNNNNIDEAVKALDKIDTQIKKMLDAIPLINPAKKDDLLTKIQEAYSALLEELSKFDAEFRAELAARETGALLANLKKTLNEQEIQDDSNAFKTLVNIYSRFLYTELIPSVLTVLQSKKTEDEFTKAKQELLDFYFNRFLLTENPKTQPINNVLKQILSNAYSKITYFLVSPEFYNKLPKKDYAVYANSVNDVLIKSYPFESKKNRLDQLNNLKQTIISHDQKLLNLFDKWGIDKNTYASEGKTPLLSMLEIIIGDVEQEPEPEPELSPEELAENLQKLSVVLMALSNQILVA